VVRVNGHNSKAFGVRISVQQRSVLSSVHFIIVLENFQESSGKAYQ